MSFLARFRVLTKIIAVVLLLCGIAAGITWLDEVKRYETQVLSLRK